MRVARASLLILAFTLPAGAQEHTARFEMTEAFLRAWARDPVRDLDVKLDCAGPVHNPVNDCEIHVSAELVDPSISDFQHVVIEPPNLCKDKGSSMSNWRKRLNQLKDRECTSGGFIRAWPEHLTPSSICSNPAHFMEVHPALTLDCGTNNSFDFTPLLEAHKDLGFKKPAIVRKMLGMKLWVCKGCTGAEGMNAIAFDYCYNEPCPGGPASNFGRFTARVVRETIRPEAGKTLDGFATGIARVKAKGSTSNQFRMLKLYAFEGTSFYDDLLAQRGKSGNVPTWDILGIFAIDPFSVLRTIDDDRFTEGEWTEVDYPVTLAVYGRL